MQDIYETTSDFVFDNIVLISPKNIQGGNYFIKFLIKDKPLYIQPPKCKTKNGILKSASKKMYCDLMFTNENERFIQWMENLENYCHQMIFKNKEKWFETELDMPDIENSFTSPLKLFKSGKFYISRTNIPCALGKCSLKIYDEEENEIHYETIKDNMDVMTILEIQGIKCSPRNFQIEIEMKQMMVLKPANLFEKCIFNPTRSLNAQSKNQYSDNKEIELSIEQKLTSIETKDESVLKNLGKTDSNLDIEIPKLNQLKEIEKIEEPINNSPISEAEKEEPEIQEIDFDLEKIDSNETVLLKTKNDIYYKMYSDARKKAKLARDLALSSYLEAKDIKYKYQLNDIEDSDSDFEGELEMENSSIL